MHDSLLASAVIVCTLSEELVTLIDITGKQNNRSCGCMHEIPKALLKPSLAIMKDVYLPFILSVLHACTHEGCVRNPPFNCAIIQQSQYERQIHTYVAQRVLVMRQKNTSTGPGSYLYQGKSFQMLLQSALQGAAAGSSCRHHCARISDQSHWLAVGGSRRSAMDLQHLKNHSGSEHGEHCTPRVDADLRIADCNNSVRPGVVQAHQR